MPATLLRCSPFARGDADLRDRVSARQPARADAHCASLCRSHAGGPRGPVAADWPRFRAVSRRQSARRHNRQPSSAAPRPQTWHHPETGRHRPSPERRHAGVGAGWATDRDRRPGGETWLVGSQPQKRQTAVANLVTDHRARRHRRSILLAGCPAAKRSSHSADVRCRPRWKSCASSPASLAT